MTGSPGDIATEPQPPIAAHTRSGTLTDAGPSTPTNTACRIALGPQAAERPTSQPLTTRRKLEAPAFALRGHVPGRDRGSCSLLGIADPVILAHVGDYVLWSMEAICSKYRRVATVTVYSS
jgi:hypothetical protein